jgi:energy-coupling factor transporter transmembrane protein EcfT
MAVLFHFLFEIVKIVILGLIYTAVIFSIRAIIRKLQKKDTDFKWYKFLIVYKVLAAVLFVFSFTYYGNHGLGDDSYIPLGHSETMSESDTFAYFVPDGKSEQMHIDTYLVKNDDLCASVDSGYMVYNLKTKQINNFNTEQLYNTFASAHNLPPIKQFRNFDHQYNNYWNGWRFWMLP